MTAAVSPLDVKSVVSLSPEKELQFRRPFTAIVKRTLTVSNSHPTVPIAFKVKTTAPKQYCVRPNSAVVPPGQQLEVQVLLQAMKEDPAPDHISKDKFLVQVIKVPADIVQLAGDELTQRLQLLWAQAEQLSKSSPATGADVLYERKLKCVFLPAEAGADAPGDAKAAYVPLTTANGSANGLNRESLKAEYSDAVASPRNSVAAAPSGAAVPAASSNIGNPIVTTATLPPAAAAPLAAQVPLAFPASATKEPTGPAGDSRGANTVTATTAIGVPTTSAAVEKELREAREKAKTLQAACDGYKAEIERLNALRQRRGDTGIGGSPVGASPTSSAQTLQTQHVGLPMPLGAGLAVLAFLLGAYFF
ncbi:phosphatidylinositol-binding protein scs2 [Geranomyces variabilis]|uniref:Phosphatidylinositol-binding protein scs2 n=1 Tax=Geranomyces variabilis TaxID=109894 RepID=A0AAD5TLG7_9FUNG|nr:phosphatidylinositol-binding protein scs2 [Geranomyces variabilis]